jgi:8-oxo-dGTP pyrophosphatase MutT (NUDIX family)
MARGGRQIIPRPDAWRLGDPAPWLGAEPVGGVADLAAVVARRPARRLAPPFPDARNSAVLIVLHDGPFGPEALFTKRAMHLRNHRGEISFPGGRMEPGETPADAALREAWEEVALDPAGVSVHGQLDHMSTVVSQSYIVPVVASVAERPPLVAHPGEVDRIMWVPLAELASSDTYREEWWGAPPTDRPIFFFDLDDETIWGATARMLHQLLRLAHGVDGPEPLAW